jgi:general stress protein 26
VSAEPAASFDGRFSDPSAAATPWADVADLLERAELYWLTTVRADGRPHVTPLIGVVHDGAAHFCTGLREQKARNLAHSDQVALTTGNNSWAHGLDVVVEGKAVRITDRDALQQIADAIEAKYGSVWHFDVGDGVFGEGERAAAVFRVEPSKVMAFAKEPHAQTAYRFPGLQSSA